MTYFRSNKVCRFQFGSLFLGFVLISFVDLLHQGAVVIMKIPCMNKSMVIMNNGQLIINSLWSNSIHEQLFIKLLWTTDHAWTIGLSIWTIDHMANCSCMNKLFIIYEQLFIISKIVHKLFIAWTIGHSMDNPSDIHKILNGCFLLFRFITNLWSFF